MRLELVGKLEDFPEGQAVEVRLGARRIAVYNIAGRLHAVKNICPHQEVELHRAPPRDGRAVCKGHGWEFDLETGACLRGKKGSRLAVYPVRVDHDGTVHINLD